MKNIYKIITLCCACSVFAMQKGLVDDSTLRDALYIVGQCYQPGVVPFPSIGSDSMNKKACFARNHLLGLAKLLFGKKAAPEILDNLPRIMREGREGFRSADQVLREALLANESLLSPLPLAEGLEVYSALAQFETVCHALNSMHYFCAYCLQNTILKGMFPSLREEATQHMLAITQQYFARYLSAYIHDNASKPEVLNKKMGENERGPITIIDMLYTMSSEVELKGVAANAEFSKLIEDVREAFWRSQLEKFWAYAQADRLCPGLVYFWRVVRECKEAKAADVALSIGQRTAFMKWNGDWSGYCFNRDQSIIQDLGIRWEEAFRLMEALTKAYTKEGDVHQDEVIQFLAKEAAVGLSEISTDVFVGEQLPKLLRIMEDFDKLDLTQRKMNLLVCSAPHLSHRTVLNPHIQSLLVGADLNFLEPEFLCSETAQILKELHLLEMDDVCSGQVSVLAAYIKDLDSKSCSVNWNQVIYDVVVGLQSSKKVTSFLIKMKAVIGKKCSDVDGFWTNALAGGKLKAFQRDALTKHCLKK